MKIEIKIDIIAELKIIIKPEIEAALLFIRKPKSHKICLIPLSA